MLIPSPIVAKAAWPGMLPPAANGLPGRFLIPPGRCASRLSNSQSTEISSDRTGEQSLRPQKLWRHSLSAFQPPDIYSVRLEAPDW